ncbi:MAG TPA: tripartite tricarboxylate transporter TctB family protein [Nocardioidaceae bacterium]|jgi:putative tricarboxylic transport membrane protein|nr:tripartite tricarboxylate transporter TctB family protein [Nocardioidaceae bacterium]
MNDNRPIPRDVALGGVTGLLGLVFVIGALTITPDPSAFKVLGPRVAPLIIGAAAVLVSIALVVRGLRPGSRPEEQPAPPDEIRTTASMSDGDADEESAGSSWRTHQRLIVTFGLLTGYVLVFIPLGYVVSTFAFLVALTTYTEPRKVLRNSLFAAAFAVVVYLVFTRGLQVQLPPGLLG